MPERQLTWPTSPHLGPRPQPPTRRFAPEPRRLQSRRPSTSLRTAVLGWASVSLVRAGSVPRPLLVVLGTAAPTGAPAVVPL